MSQADINVNKNRVSDKLIFSLSIMFDVWGLSKMAAIVLRTCLVAVCVTINCQANIILKA